MGMVPDPQKGSHRGSRPRYRDRSTMAAARVSRRGAATPLGPVAPLVEPRSGGVQHQDGLIPHDGELHLVEGSGLRQGVQAVLGPQTGGDGLLDDGLAGGH